MRYWFTADLHFGHANIIKFCNRPFKNVEDMNYKLLRNINDVVKYDDVLIHVGDFTSSYDKVNAQKILDRINCKVILVKGNHDKGSLFKIEDLTFIIGQKFVHVIHIPELAQHEYNIVGHVHTLWKTKIEKDEQGRNKYLINVGCDAWNYKPVSIKAINKQFESMKRMD